MFIILLILIFIRPFISSLAFPDENAAYSALSLIFLAIWLIKRKFTFKDYDSVKYALLFFILAIFVSIIFSKDKGVSLKELYKYISGVLLLVACVSLSPSEKNRVISWLLAAGFLISLLAIYQYSFGFRHLLKSIASQGLQDSFALGYISRRRPFFPFVTPNILAGYLAIVLPLAFTAKNRAWVGLIILVALLLTKSLGALLSVFLALALYFYLWRNFKKTVFMCLAGLLIAVAVVFITRSTLPQQHTQPLFSLTMRINYWRDALRIIFAYPLTGVGPGIFNLTYSRYAHNSYLQIWAEMGILGIISFLWLVIALFKSGLRNFMNSADKKLIAGLITACAVFLFHNLFDFTFFLPEVALIWWVINGIILSRVKIPA